MLDRIHRKLGATGMILAALALLGSLIVGVVLANAAAPTVTVEDASSVSYQTAQVEGTVDPGGETTSYRFQYITEANYQQNVGNGNSGFEGAASGPSGSVEGSGAQAVSGELSGLEPNTTYHLRLTAENAGGSVGTVAANTFTTQAVAAPAVTIAAASEVELRAAKAEGTVELAQNDPAFDASCKFQFATHSDFSDATSVSCEPQTVLASEAQPVTVTANLTELTPNTTYYLRLVATNSGGTGEAVAPTFTTPIAAPVVGSTFVSEVTTNAAKLRSQVNPSGAATTYRFEYGTTTSYGNITPLQGPLPADGADHPVSAEISGLQANTTYHYRLLATNSVETVAGPDATFTTFAEPSPYAPCPNDALRTGPSANLPDCRAYEQVSPVDKNGADAQGYPNAVQASESGDAVTFVSHAGLPGGVGSQDFPFYLARRGAAGGWTSSGILPPSKLGIFIRVQGWTSNLEHAYVSVGFLSETPLRAPSLVSRESETGAYSVVLPETANPEAPISNVAGASADGSKVYFQIVGVAAAPGVGPESNNLFVWNRATGKVQVAGVLPGADCEESVCAPEGGAFAGSYAWITNNRGTGGISARYFVQDAHAVSEDGNTVYFTAGTTGQVYARLDAASPSARTEHISESQRASGDPNGPQPAIFWAATPSGSKAFFSSCEKLTDDSTAHSTGTECEGSEPEQGQDLYVYEAATKDLRDLTVDGGDPEGADVQAVLGTSTDGDYVYFVANGDLDGGGPGTLGNCVHEGGENYSGSCNIYVWHNGATSFVAPVNAVRGRVNWQPRSLGAGGGEKQSRVSANGTALLFLSELDLSKYKSEGTGEFYRYDASDSKIVCVTCSRSGVPPASFGAALRSIRAAGEGFRTSAAFSTRNLSADGNRVYFESVDRLVPADTNGLLGCAQGSCRDVYQWEAPGTGSCPPAEDEGCISLISTGKSNEPSYFADASASGQDVFIFSRESLVPQDQDNLVDVYDAHVDGGLASQHVTSAPPCDPSSGTCQRSSTEGGAATVPGTSQFTGSGNVPHAKKKKAAKHHHRKHRRRKAGHPSSRSSSGHRRGAQGGSS